MIEIIARASNRVFVGLPLCSFFSYYVDTSSAENPLLGRDPAFLAIATSFTLDVSKSRLVVNLFPPILKGYVMQCFTFYESADVIYVRPVAKLINKVPAAIRRAHRILEPMIQERRLKVEECLQTGDVWEDKPVRSP